MTTSIMWFRRDLRVRDLPALAAAARADRVVPLFVFDERLLTTGRFPSGPRTAFMLGCLRELDAALRERGGALVVRHGRPEDVLPALAREVGADEVRWTADVSPWARARDENVRTALAGAGVQGFATPGGCVVDDPAAIVTNEGRPYTVFSPFARRWRAVERRPLAQAPRAITLPDGLDAGVLPSLDDLGLTDPTDSPFVPGEEAARRRAADFLRDGLDDYPETRNLPVDGSSRLSPYLRWGCISPTHLDRRAAEHGGPGTRRFRDELAWRDFYTAVLLHHPEVVGHELQDRYRELEWDADPGGHRFRAWCEGRTGYPLVDAGMRQLRREGWMPNRVRMVAGSFLTKDLQLDWRKGEAEFMRWLLDGDMAANNGNWQWIASVGADPAPYFQRLFNPTTQQERFDPEGEYVRRWVHEWGTSDYPDPIVDHAAARRRAIERYRAVAGLQK